MALLTTGSLAVLVTCLLWWTYFGWAREFMEHAVVRLDAYGRVRVARDAYSLGHFPLICGVISLAVGFENVLSHPAEPLSGPIALALWLGVALFVGTTAGVMWRTTRLLLWPRLLIALCTGAALWIAVQQPPAMGLALTALGLALIIVVERRLPANRARPE